MARSSRPTEQRSSTSGTLKAKCRAICIWFQRPEGDATKILSPSELPPPSRPPEKENKLDYGLPLRDEFVKERENQLGNFEWSPDSKRLVTSYGGDLYVITIGDKQARRLTRTQAPESRAQVSRQSIEFFFRSPGNLFVLDLSNSLLTQVSKEANVATFISIFNATA
jgi:hypothetical protein